MVVLFVAAVFAVFVTIDLVQERRRRRELTAEGMTLHDSISEGQPNFVAGYELPEALHYHKNHMWVHWVGPDQAIVGVDDFGRRLLGHPKGIKTPPVGAWVEQGSRAVKVQHNGESAHLGAPVSGEVLAVNPRLKGDPDAVHRDNYGQGWLYKIRSPRLVEQVGNLLDGSLASRWMEDTRDRFHHQLVLATGSVIQDGGTTIDDLASELDSGQWKSLVHEFLEPVDPKA